MKLTIFESQVTQSKFPISPYKDPGNNTFKFVTIDIKLENALEYLSSEFVLNRSYDIPKPMKLTRTKKDLHQYLTKEFDFVIIDIDEVKSQFQLNKIVEWFEKSKYNVALGPSKSFNGRSIFNQKGIIEAKGLNNRESLRKILEDIKAALFGLGKVDITALNEAAFQAPTNKLESTLIKKGGDVPKAFITERKIQKFDVKATPLLKSALDVCIDHYRSMGFIPANINEEMITFSHPNEKTSKGYFLFLNNPFNMKHFNPEKNFNIFHQVRERKDIQMYLEDTNNQRRKDMLTGIGNSNFTYTVNERYLSINPKLCSFVDKWFEKKGLLKIKSAMGTGKSSIIEKIIKKSKKESKPVLLITNRISVAMDFQKKYGLKLYSDNDYTIGDSLIVQLESLHKYSLKYFEVVILDEFMSLMLHSRNVLSDYANLNRVKLQYALRNKLVVIADAFLYGGEDMFTTSKPTFCINNTYREDIQVIETKDPATFVQNISEVALKEKKENRKVSVSCSSKMMTKVIQRVCENKGLNALVLNADSSNEDKELIYKLFDKEEHTGWDVFIYTPTLTVGVSNLNVSKYHFHYDESNSMDVISSIQMIRRTRKAEVINFMVLERKKYLQTSLKALNDEIVSNITKYYIKNKSSLLIEIDEEGDPRLSATGEFINIAEVLFNILESNHKHSFELLLTHQIKNKVIQNDSIPKKKLDIASIRAQIKEEEHIKMVQALENMDEINYNPDVIDDFKHRTHLITDEDKMMKLISEIKPHLVETITPGEMRVIVEREVKTKFNYIKKLKKLKLFLTKNESDVKNILSHIIGENITNKAQIEFFDYLKSVKAKKIQLKQKYTTSEMKKIDSYIGYKSFKSFIQKIGYRKSGSVYTITQKMIDDAKFVR